MSNTFARPRAPRLFVAVAWFAVWFAAIGTVVALVFTSVLDAWWPETGQAFAASSPTRTQQALPAEDSDACALIVGPAHNYCARPAEGSKACSQIVGPAHEYCLMGVTQAAQRGPGDSASGTLRVLLLVPVGLGLVLVLRLRRSTPAAP